MKKFFAALCLAFMMVSCQNHDPDALDLVRHIPKDSPVIIKINNLSLFESALINNDFIKAIKPASFYNDILEALKTTAWLKPEDEVLLCFNEIGKQDFEYALITKNHKDMVVVDSLGSKKTDTIAYDGAEIKRLSINSDVFFTTIIDNVFIVSSSRLLAENIVRQRNVNDTAIDETFYKLYETSDAKKSATVFINNEKAAVMSGILFEGNISGYIRDFADWTTMELSVLPDAIAATGIAMSKTLSLKTMGLFHNTVPQENRTAALSPVTASGFVSFTFDRYAQLRANMALRNGNKSPETTKSDSIFRWTNEIGIIYEKDKKSIVMHSLDAARIKSILTDSNAPVSEFRESEIYKCDDPDLFTAAFTPLITDISVSFYTFIEDFVLFSDTEDTVKRMITNYQNKTTLIHSESFVDFTGGLSDKASLLAVGLQPGLKEALQKNIGNGYKKDIKAISFKDYPYFAFQISNDRDFAHVAFLIKKASVENNDKTVAQTLSVVLDADMAISPQFVVNHRTKQQEIIVQDTENTLYLISNTGKIRWKKKLDGKIQGRVQQVDLYKNGKLQLIFVTQRKLQIIDRNGNEVAPFPISFNDNISLPLAVFDYDKNKNYRFLVCRGKKLSMYNNRGEVVSGFTLSQTQSNILFTPRHFRIGTKDYLVIAEENGKLNILHRTGKTRIEVNRKIGFSDNTVYLYNNKFTTTNKAGALVQIDEKGGIAIRNMGLEQDHRISTTSRTMVSLSDNALSIKGKKVTLDFGFYTPPRIFLVNNKIYVSLTDTQTNKIYMYDSNAVLLSHFPVYGMSAVDMGDIDNDNKPEFTVQGDKNAILLYKMK